MMLGDFQPLSLSLRDSFLAILAGSVATHLIFKRWEPVDLYILGTLLVAVPVALSTLLIPHFGIILGVAATSLSFYAGLLTSIVLYRVSFIHPLARYPGPLACKISKVWVTWYAAKGCQHTYIQSLHNQYGEIVRIGPNELSIRNPDVIPLMMGTNGLPKGPSLSGRALHPPISSIIATRDPAIHAKRRRPWTRAFSTAALKEYQPMVAKRAAQLTERLAETDGIPTDLALWIAYFTYDFMGDLVFGGGTEMLRDGDVNGLVRMLKGGFSAGMTLEHLPWLSYLAKQLPLAENMKKMRLSAYERTKTRYERGATSKDLFYYLSNEDGVDPVNPSMGQVLSDSVLAVAAGSDTTASVLTSTVFFLLRNPEYYKRLQEEVDKFYPRGDNGLDPAHHSKMVILEAVINETLRMYPVLLSGSQRAPQIGHGDRTVGPYYIPEGNQARVHFYSVHRDPNNFSYPDTWWPERWLIAEGLVESSEKPVHNVNAFVPFSFGPSNCVGKNLAQQEMRMVITNLMQKLEMRLADGWDADSYERNIKDQFVVEVPSLMVSVKRRD